MKKKNIGLVLALLSGIILASCQKETVKFVVLDDEISVEEYAIGFRKGDNALKNKVEEGLVELAKDGTLAEISTKWFTKDNTLISKDYAVDTTATDSSWTYIEEKKKLKLGFDSEFPPMTFKDENGEYVGFDIEVAAAVCDYLDVTLELVPIVWDRKELELTTKSIDVIWCGLTINDERKENLTLSIPYIGNAQVAVVREGTYTSLAELKGKTIGAQSGSTALDAISKSDDLKDNPLIKNDNNVSLLRLELAGKNVEAVIMDKVVAAYYIAINQ